MMKYMTLTISILLFFFSTFYVSYYISIRRKLNNLISDVYGAYEGIYRHTYTNNFLNFAGFSNKSPYSDCFEPRKFDPNISLTESKPRRLNNYQIFKDNIEAKCNSTLKVQEIVDIQSEVHRTNKSITKTFVLYVHHISRNYNNPIVILRDPYDSIMPQPTNLKYSELKKNLNRLIVVDLTFVPTGECLMSNIKETIYTYDNILDIKDLKKLSRIGVSL